MLAFKGLFSRPGIFNKLSRIFELQPRMSFVSARTQHYMSVPHKPLQANKTIQIHEWFIIAWSICITAL
jgi:hypothetical protein